MKRILNKGLIVILITLLLYLSLQVPAPVTGATELFSDGFETGDFSAWTGTAVTSGDTLGVQSSIKHHGTYAARSLVNNGGADYAYAYKRIAGRTTLYARAYIRIAQRSISGNYYHVQVLQIFGNGFGLARLQPIRWSDGAYRWRVSYWNKGTWQYPGLSALPQWALDTWYCVEIKVVVGSGTGEVRVYIDGSETYTVTGLDNDDKTTVADEMRLGIDAGFGGATWEVYADCGKMSDTYIGQEGLYTVHNLNTGLSYETIQAAINAPETLNGHTIRVDAGTYYEHVVVNKTVKLIGEEVSTTIIDGNGTGAVLNVTANNTIISGFTIQNGYYGYVDASFNSSFSGNNIINNYYGIRAEAYSIISGNNITNNSVGISLFDTSENFIYHNIFVDNINQVSINVSKNVWDDGYPSGGNFWSDYNGPDILRGPYQNETGGDGIGDEPYIIDANNTDRYPLIHPLGTLNYGFSDNFDDDSTDFSRWIKIEKYNGTVLEINGRVEANVPTPRGTAGYVTLMSYNLLEADIQIGVSNQYLCEATIAITLEGSKDHFWYSDNFYVIEKHKAPCVTEGLFYPNLTLVKKRVNGGEHILLYNGTWTGSSGYLRIRIYDGTIYFYEEENLRYSEPFALNSYNCYISFEANTWHEDYIGMDYFDNFTFTTERWNLPPLTPIVISPNGGEWWSGTHNITWAASTDPDGDPVTYEIEYYNGTSWQNLASGISTTFHEWDTSRYPDTLVMAGYGSLVRVRAYDGELHSSWDQSDGTFAIDNTIPLVEIVSPLNGENISSISIQIQGNVWHPPIPAGLAPHINDTRFSLQSWDGERSFVFRNDTPILAGKISVMVSFTDWAGNVASDTVSFIISGATGSSISIAVSSSTALVGYKVIIMGRLTWQHGGAGISNAPILVSYGYHPDLMAYIPSEKGWNVISTVTTGADGSYSVTWFVMSSGYYVIEVFYPGSDGVQGATNTTNLLITNLDNHVFSVSSNSTVSAMNFNSTAREIHFTVSGPTGTSGYLDIFLAKSLIPNLTELKIYFDGVEKSFDAILVNDTWFIRLTYPHSTHTIRINLASTLPPSIPLKPMASLTLAIIAAALAIVALLPVLKTPMKSLRLHGVRRLFRTK